MKNHEKARKFYEETDPEKDSLDMVCNKICNAIGNYTLKSLMQNLGKRFAHDDAKEAINILEAIYEAFDPQSQQMQSKHVMQYLHDAKQFRSEFNEFTDKDRNDLFEEAFNNMLQTAEKYNREDILKALEEYYPEQQAQAIGESGDVV